MWVELPRDGDCQKIVGLLGSNSSNACLGGDAMSKRALFWCAGVFLMGVMGCAHNDPLYISDAEMIKDIEAHNAKIKDENDKIVCKRFRPTGTLLMRTVCRTKRNWEIQKHGAQEMMQKPRAGVQRN